jgi:Tol biopolymer transport system component
MAVRAPLDGTISSKELIANVAGNGASYLSPDGAMVAASVWDTASLGVRLTVVPATGGAELYSLRFPPAATSLRWSPDSRSMQYSLIRRGAGNIWDQPLSGGPPRQITSFTDRTIADFDWSRDGKHLAVVRGTMGRDIVLMTDFN